MDKQGLPTVVLYLGLFALAGFLGVAAFGLLLALFLWIWMHVCDWTGLSAHIPSHGVRLLLGSLLFLVIAALVCAKLWKDANPPRTPR